jgi:hypothetical protein
VNVTDLDIYNELRAIRGALEALPKAIALAVRDELLEPVPEAPAPQGCQHPEDKRANLGDGEWECTVRGCGFRHVPEPVTS